MESLEQIKARLEAAVPGAGIELLPNGCPAGERSLVVDPAHALAAAKVLRDDPQWRLDFCSNVTGVDWLDAEHTEKIKVKRVVDGVEREIEAGMRQLDAGGSELMKDMAPSLSVTR